MRRGLNCAPFAATTKNMKIQLQNNTINNLETELAGKPLIIKAGEIIDVTNGELIELKRKHNFLRLVKTKEEINESLNIINNYSIKEQMAGIKKEAEERGYFPTQELKLNKEKYDKTNKTNQSDNGRK